MSKANEARGIEMEKRANILAEKTKAFFGELNEFTSKEQVGVAAKINQFGPPTVELISGRPNPARTLFQKLRLKKYVPTEKERLKTIETIIKAMLAKHGLVWFAVITPAGAQVQTDLSAEIPMPESGKLWTPPDMGKLAGVVK